MQSHRLIGLALGCGALVLPLSHGCSDDAAQDDDTTSTNNAAGGAGGAGGGGGTAPAFPFNGNCDAPSGTPGSLKITPVAMGLSKTLEVTAPRGDDERVFVIEQDGRIQMLKNGVPSVFLDISAKVISMGEQGLLGLAFHPNYGENGRFFVHYSGAGDGRTVIEEYKRSDANPDVADPTAVGIIDEIDQPAANHNGGTIQFNDQDGFLYIGLGDGGGGYDTFGNGQNLGTKLGKLLRIDVDTTPYSIPPGNLAGAGAPEIYDYGLRNPYRWSFDACTGDRYIGDVGQDCYEEVDIAAYDSGNKNFGWPIMEGLHCLEQGNCNLLPGNGCADDGLEPAVLEYGHVLQSHSVVGGYVYRGHAIPWLRGTYLYAEFYSGQVFSLRWENGAVSGQTELTDDLGTMGTPIAGFGQDNLGEMYIATFTGSVYKIEPE